MAMLCAPSDDDWTLRNDPETIRHWPSLVHSGVSARQQSVATLRGWGTPAWADQTSELRSTLQEVRMADSHLDQSFEQMVELQNFLYAFLGRLEAEKLKPGQDLTPLVKQIGLELPALLRGEPIVWEGHTTAHFAAHGGDAPVLAFVRPGHADAIGLVIGCIHTGRWTICLECGWIWCRIVVTRKF